MAIQLTTTIKGNIEIPNAYLKIGKIHEEDKICEYSIYIYKDKNEADSKNFADIKYDPTYKCAVEYNNGKDFRQQCYEHMKSSDEFIGGIDVLEEGQTA